MNYIEDDVASIPFTTANWKPLTLATVYRSHREPDTNVELPAETIEQLLEKAKKHPRFNQTNAVITHKEQGAFFVGFDKPWLLDGYALVYPNELRYSAKWNHFALFAQQHALKLGLLRTRENTECIEITRGTQRFFLIDTDCLLLRHWSIAPRIDEDQILHNTLK